MIGLIFLLPMLGAQLGIDMNILGWLLGGPVDAVINVILRISGNS